MNQINYPSDSNGQVCGYDIPGKPYLNFTDAPLIVPLLPLRPPEPASRPVPPAPSPATVLFGVCRHERPTVSSRKQSSDCSAVAPRQNHQHCFVFFAVRPLLLNTGAVGGAEPVFGGGDADLSWIDDAHHSVPLPYRLDPAGSALLPLQQQPVDSRQSSGGSRLRCYLPVVPVPDHSIPTDPRHEQVVPDLGQEVPQQQEKTVPLHNIFLHSDAGTHIPDLSALPRRPLHLAPFHRPSQHIPHRTFPPTQPNALNFQILAPILVIYAVWASHVLK